MYMYISLISTQSRKYGNRAVMEIEELILYLTANKSGIE